MAKFRYDAVGRWYKGNTHIHTTASDGGKTASAIAAMYAGAGYDFLVRTDHWAASDVAADPSEGGTPPLLWLDGIELDGPDPAGDYLHVVCLGRVTGLAKPMGLAAAMASARRQGALLVLAHPHWSGNGLEAALRHGFDGVEAYNHVCRWLNGKGDGGAYWTAMLDGRPGTLAFAADDAHLRPEHPGWNGGWICVRAAELSHEAIPAAIRAGAFYSSCGPEFHDIRCRDGCVEIATSPVAFARLVGPGSQGRRMGYFDGTLFTGAAFDLPAEWAWAYVEIEDGRGRRAWTNCLTAG